VIFAVLAAGSVLVGAYVPHDGDSGRLHTDDGRNIPIRLQGIDAPETAPYGRCHQQPKIWACSSEARPFGRTATSRARELSADAARCTDTGERPSHGRLIVRCSFRGQDLGTALVLEGLAISEKQFGDQYRREEHEAQRDHRGVWK
jgi:endonuclease YncB( thermonuclease family)